jgi:5-enolpyruvylshikimate-3-phosphate synthase
VAGLAASANITIRGWSSVATSFPGFLETMKAAQRG